MEALVQKGVVMKKRPYGFLQIKQIQRNPDEVFDYIVELHKYLWIFVCHVSPGIGGNLEACIDMTLNKLGEKQYQDE